LSPRLLLPEERAGRIGNARIGGLRRTEAADMLVGEDWCATILDSKDAQGPRTVEEFTKCGLEDGIAIRPAGCPASWVRGVT